jgi:hypothetical protein
MFPKIQIFTKYFAKEYASLHVVREVIPLQFETGTGKWTEFYIFLLPVAVSCLPDVTEKPQFLKSKKNSGSF